MLVSGSRPVLWVCNCVVICVYVLREEKGDGGCTETCMDEHSPDAFNPIIARGAAQDHRCSQRPLGIRNFVCTGFDVCLYIADTAELYDTPASLFPRHD